MTSIVDPHRRTGTLSGRCLCGAVEIDVDGDYIAAVGACHCIMCQRWSGLLFGAFLADSEAVTVRGQVTKYESSSFAERAFCSKCGSPVWLRNTQKPDEDYELMPGMFPAAAEFPLISEIYTDRAPKSLNLAGDHRRKTRAEYEAKAQFVEGDLT